MMRQKTARPAVYAKYDANLGWVNPNIDLPNVYGPGGYVKINAGVSERS